MNTSDNTVFISGGSAGIGLEIAKMFSANGNKVIINGRDEERLNDALKQLNNAVAIKGDLSVISERIQIAEELKQNHADLLPVGKVALPEDIALTYIYLMEQSYSTRQTVIVDGNGVLINIYARP